LSLFFVVWYTLGWVSTFIIAARLTLFSLPPSLPLARVGLPWPGAPKALPFLSLFFSFLPKKVLRAEISSVFSVVLAFFGESRPVSLIHPAKGPTSLQTPFFSLLVIFFSGMVISPRLFASCFFVGYR